MNKVKMFFVAAALVLMTAGVFAGKARFAGPTNVYYKNGASYPALFLGLSGTDNLWSTSSTTQGQAFVIISGTQYPIYSTQNVSSPIYTLY
jgi:hypothetical protein